MHWTEAFGDLRDINRITAGDGIQGGHANMAKTDEEMSQQMVESLDNLANAAVTKNDTVERLVLANKKLSDLVDKLTADNAKLIGIIAQMSLCCPIGTPNTAQSTGSKQAWDPTGYCWSHGFKVRCGHNGKTCTKRADGHKEEATRGNTMGGRTWNEGFPKP